MINFACKDFNLNEIIKCSLNLTKIELRILEFLIKNNNEYFSSYDLSKKLKIGLSTSQKALKKLYKKEILIQRQKNIDKGGYFYIYKIIDKTKIKQKILDIINNWVNKLNEEIKRW